MDASRDQRVLSKTKILSVFFFFSYLGFGTLSSGTAVQTESGVFCSLNRPLNTFSMSSMLNAQTAEPGMLKKRNGIRRQWACSRFPQVRCGRPFEVPGIDLSFLEG